MGTPFDDPIVPVYQAKYRRIFGGGGVSEDIPVRLIKISTACALFLIRAEQDAPGLFLSSMV
jgi:hypothetical protein